MNDIFLSYASNDRAVAHKLADAFEALGWSVWWDREVPIGKSFDQVIEQELTAARCVVVLWSEESARSRWVKTEAAAAADQDRLIPVLIEDVAIPLEFKRIQTAMLQGWNGESERPEFLLLVDSIRQMLGQPSVPSKPVQRSSSPRSRLLPRIAIGAGAAVLVLVILVKLKFDSKKEPAAPPVAADRTVSPQMTSPGASLPIQRDVAAVGANPTPRGTAPGVVALKIGDKIEDGVPVAGAGNIQSPGAKNIYTFTAPAGARVYFRKLQHDPGMEQIRWTLADSDGANVFDERLYAEPGAHLLRKGGAYTMTIGSDQVAATGTYRLQVLPIPPPHQFAIKVGDKIKENVPGRGAGYIESPGVKDVYTFSVAAGQRMYFRKFEHDKGMEQVKWVLADADGAVIFDARLFEEPGTQLLRKAGTYTMTVGSDSVPATGSYHMQLFDVPPPQSFAIKIGDTISAIVPAAGAGQIETPGAKDLYTFTATPGQRVYFRKLAHEPGMEQIAWRLQDSDGTEVFESRLFTEPGAQVLRKGGSYTLSVGSDRAPATGTYSLQLSNAPDR